MHASLGQATASPTVIVILSLSDSAGSPSSVTVNNTFG